MRDTLTLAGERHPVLVTPSQLMRDTQRPPTLTPSHVGHPLAHMENPLAPPLSLIGFAYLLAISVNVGQPSPPSLSARSLIGLDLQKLPGTCRRLQLFTDRLLYNAEDGKLYWDLISSLRHK